MRLIKLMSPSCSITYPLNPLTFSSESEERKRLNVKCLYCLKEHFSKQRSRMIAQCFQFVSNFSSRLCCFHCSVSAGNFDFAQQYLHSAPKTKKRDRNRLAFVNGENFFSVLKLRKMHSVGQGAREGAKFFNFCSDSMSRSMARKGAVIDSEQLVWRLTKRDLFSVSCRQWRRRLRLDSRNRFTIGSPPSATSKVPLKINFCENS